MGAWCYFGDSQISCRVIHGQSALRRPTHAALWIARRPMGSDQRSSARARRSCGRQYQGEELYVRAEEGQRRRFSELLAQALPDPRLHIMMSMRSDFLGHLQNDKPLFKVRQHIDVPPLGGEELREIVSRPAQLLSARFETDGLVDMISRRTAEDAVKDVGALPLLSYTLDEMWAQMVRRDDATLRLPAQSFELGGVLVDRANR